MKCPECGGPFCDFRRDEEFDFDTGRGVVRVFAKKVPNYKCEKCGLVAIGPMAAGKRADATLRAVLDLLHRQIKLE